MDLPSFKYLTNKHIAEAKDLLRNVWLPTIRNIFMAVIISYLLKFKLGCQISGTETKPDPDFKNTTKTSKILQLC